MATVPHRSCWQATKWGRLATLEYGRSLRDYEPERSVQKPYRVFGTNGPIGWHSAPLYSEPSIVVGRKGAYRGIHFSANPFFVIDTAFYLRPTTEFEIRWAYYQLKNFDINKLDSGSAIPSTSRDAFYEIPVALPPLLIQRRIAGILSAYDDLIENCQRRIRILEDMARGLYREWFVNFRFPGAEAVPLVESALGAIPQGWEVCRVGGVTTVFRGRSYRTTDLAEEGGLPFVNLKCLDRDGGFRRSGLKRYVGDFKADNIVRPGDIVMAVTDMTQDRRIVARAAWIPTLNAAHGVLSMDLVRIEPAPTVPKHYLYAFLRFSGFADEVKQHANGANVLHLSPDRIRDYSFARPSPELMERFGNAYAPMLALTDGLENAVENLRRTRDLLLPRLLSGQISVESAEGDLDNVRHGPASTHVPREAPSSSRSPDRPKLASKEAPNEEVESDADDRPIPIDDIDTSLVLQLIRSLFADGQPRAREDAVRDLARALGYRRTGHRIAEVLEKDLTTAVRRGILDNSVRGMLSLLTRSVQDLDRDFLKTQFLASLDGHNWTDRDSAVRNFARWMGYARTGEVIDATARSLMNGLLREGRIEANGVDTIRRVSQSREAQEG
jgi:type I restriction enzyme S subunit